MEEIRALLEKWAKLQPTRCGYYKQPTRCGYYKHMNRPDHVIMSVFCATAKQFVYLLEGYLLDEILIQAAIREAVAEIKGSIDIFSDFAEYDLAPLHIVKIYNSAGSCRAFSGPNLTIAMLECWLMVLHDKN